MTEQARSPSPDEQPRPSRGGLILSWVIWFGVPPLLLCFGLLLIAFGFSASILLVLLPFVVGLPVLVLLVRRSGANVLTWDDDRLLLQCADGDAEVHWSDIVWFQKLWATHKLEGGGKAWIATLVNYRGHAGRQKTVLLTLSGSAGEGTILQPLRASKYQTILDVKVPARNQGFLSNRKE